LPALSDSPKKPIRTVRVRDLVAFVLKRGDLGAERQFVSSDRALAGIRGHQKIQRSRPPGYEMEISVQHELDAGEFLLRIRGRIDGLLRSPDGLLIEEIKTVQGKWDHEPDPLHWAQAKFYGFFQAHEHALSELTIQLVYLELESGKITEFRSKFSFTELSEFFQATTAIYIDWLREQHRWEIARDQSIRELTFPFSAYRSGQRELAVAAYRVVANGGRLFVAAPTGIGKTVSVLFPAIKALGEAKLERIFYLTARTVGRTIAEKGLGDLRNKGLKLRAVTLTAREKLCIRDGQPCDTLTCPLARGYYDRIKPAVRDALNQQEITRPVLTAVAQKHQVCPFELALDISLWADAIICDYNYVFDPQVYLRRHFAEEGGDYAFLVDEAHNLVDRARDMFSAELESQEILGVKQAIKSTVPRCAKALTKLLAAMRQLGEANTEEPAEISNPSVELNLFPGSKPTLSEAGRGVSISHDFPDSLIPALETVLMEAEVWLVQNKPADFQEVLLTLYFQLRSFQRVAEQYDECFVTIVEAASGAKVRLFCLDPSRLLRHALERGKSAVFFSATLTPVNYYRNLLGGSPEDPVLQLSSPFPPENLAVLVHDRIQTHFKGRAGSLREVAAAIGTLVQGRPGNYLVYFPSFQYLKDVLQEFQSLHPTMPVLVQRPAMAEPEREAFLAAFAVEHGDRLVGFAVMGGVFGEGIDLVGERLIGAVIVGVGLPQLCTERDLIRDYFQKENSAGFDYAYTFPGMNRVLQAVGRVIRSEKDRGVVLLIDARFSELRYRKLFPPWWKYARVRHAATLQSAVGEFWAGS
jgi:DNA excision repair protein ERCC-2